MSAIRALGHKLDFSWRVDCPGMVSGPESLPWRERLFEVTMKPIRLLAIFILAALFTYQTAPEEARPFLPNEGIGLPVAALSAMR